MIQCLRPIFKIPLSAFALGSVVVVHSAEAAITAAGGSAFVAAQAGCFTRTTSGQVVNTCGPGTRRWCVSDYITSSGTKNVVVNGFIPSEAAELTCFARAVTKTGMRHEYDERRLTTFGSDQDLRMSVKVPSFGGLMICCDMPQNSRMNTINY